LPISLKIQYDVYNLIKKARKGCCIIDVSSKIHQGSRKNSFEGNGYKRGNVVKIRPQRRWFSQYQNYYSKGRLNPPFTGPKPTSYLQIQA